MQVWSKSTQKPRRIGFLLFDRFSNLALANLLEPLRAANMLLGRQAYEWQIGAPENGVVHSSSGLPVMPTVRLSDLGPGDTLFAVASYDYQAHATPGNAKTLRVLAGRFQTMAGVDTGGWLLAAAGLLDGGRATIHYDLLDAFAERFPTIEVERARWVKDRDRITCSGGMAAYELACDLIKDDHGAALLLEVTQLFMSDSMTTPHALTRVRGDRRVEVCLREMEAHIETPLTIPDLARRSGCRLRDLEQRFARHFGATPRQVYRRLRLNAAKRMLADGGTSIAEVALRAGYGDASAFARAFRAEFGLTPRDAARDAPVTTAARRR
ncbi:AraC family transcriptional regulator [Aliiroseovarius zhejiangensis]|uniref:AraC family transcriptional regulator n=1 Tax=Aliiroseovarius zhejiangensis TaxID=1632025 RepID=A0ABQ3ITY9_9RHOB|nr:helix-turn-helix domain-containing protein [Aliiroseovarius zhejiangensis]GHE94302.1 AraC family transcriptional regulator [Aliiroseovarius zhejiangensis]